MARWWAGSLDCDLGEVIRLLAVFLVAEPQEAEAALGSIAAQAGCAALRCLGSSFLFLGELGKSVSREGLLLLNAGLGGAGDQGEKVGRAAGSVGVERHFEGDFFCRWTWRGGAGSSRRARGVAGS